MVRKYFGTDGIRGKANEGAMTAETGEHWGSVIWCEYV